MKGIVYTNSDIMAVALQMMDIAGNRPNPELTLIHRPPFEVTLDSEKAKGLVDIIHRKMPGLKYDEHEIFRGLCEIVGGEFEPQLNHRCLVLSRNIAIKLTIYSKKANLADQFDHGALRQDTITKYNEVVNELYAEAQEEAMTLVEPRLRQLEAQAREAKIMKFKKGTNIVINVLEAAHVGIVLGTASTLTFGAGTFFSCLALLRNFRSVAHDIYSLAIPVHRACVRAIKGIDKLQGNLMRDGYKGEIPFPRAWNKSVKKYGTASITSAVRAVIGVSATVDFTEEQERIDVAKGKVGGVLERFALCTRRINQFETSLAEWRHQEEFLSEIIARNPDNVDPAVERERNKAAFMVAEFRHSLSIIGHKSMRLKAEFDRFSGKIQEIEEIFDELKKTEKGVRIASEVINKILTLAQFFASLIDVAAEAHKVATEHFAEAGEKVKAMEEVQANADKETFIDARDAAIDMSAIEWLFEGLCNIIGLGEKPKEALAPNIYNSYKGE